MTVATRVDALLDAGLVAEMGAERGTAGRPSKRLEFHLPTPPWSRQRSTRPHDGRLTDLAGRVRAEERIDVAVADGPVHTLSTIAQRARALLGTTPGVDRVAAIGISVPGPVDPDTGRPSQPPIMPGWDAYPIPEHLTEELGVPALVANDADAAALGEQRSAHPDSRALCLIKVSSGIGAGIVLGGRVYRGPTAVRAISATSRSRGTTTWSASAGRTGASPRSPRERGRAVPHPAGQAGPLGIRRGGLPRCRRPRRHPAHSGSRPRHRRGRRDGPVARPTSEVVLGGMLASAPLLTGVRETLYPRSLPRATRHLTMSLSTLRQQAATVGLAALVVDREYSAAAVNRGLAR